MAQNGKERVVAITGASAGIGRATALRLARDGAAIVASARGGPTGSSSSADEIEAAGGRALTVVADVTREADMNDLVARAVERFGRLDVMICNAGFGIYGAIDDITPDQMQQARGRQLFRHLLRHARGAARLPPPGRGPHRHRVVDRRQARRAVHGRVRRDEVRAGRAGRMPARPSWRDRAST